MKDLKVICIISGIIFGLLIYLCSFFALPSSILLIIGGIQMFEYSHKQKTLLKESVKAELKQQEDMISVIKKDYDKLKIDLDSLKMKQGFSQLK